MKFVGTLFQDKPASLEEGPLKYRSTNEYVVLQRDTSTTNCSKFVQIVKLILWIELIILIGWLGCLSFSHYNNYRNSDCGESATGCKASEVDYDHIEVENSRGRRGVPDTEDEREKCEKNANATRKRLASFAAHFVNGESSDPTVVQLRSDFIDSTVSESMLVVVVHALLDAFDTSLMGDNGTTNTSLLWMIPDDNWPALMQLSNERFLNSTNSENRQRLTAIGSPTGEMASEYRAITESLYIYLRDCNGKSNENAQRRKRESEPVIQPPIDCRDAEAQLLTERRERHEAIAAEIASDHQPLISTMILLSSIDSALSAKRPSEVTVEDHLLQDDSGLIPWKRFMSDAPLELKKEFYRLVRDEFLELRNETNQPSAWEGYDLGKAYRNWTDGLSILTQSESPDAVFNITIKFGKAFDLHYIEAEREDSAIDSEAPVFGKLTYLGAEPEKLGVRRLRHILNGFLRLYFRVINRLGPCQPATDETPTRNRRFVKTRSVTPDPEPESNTATCWNGEHDLALFEERRARLAAVAIENATGKLEVDDRDLLTAIETALNASSTSEIRFDEKYTRPRMMMHAIIYLTSNASLELHKEVYEIVRDVFLQLRSLNSSSSPEWEGYDTAGILRNVLNNINLPIVPTAESIFDNFVRIGEPFKLRYVELQRRDIGADPDKPVFGKFNYTGEQPEIMGVRHMRHILEAFVKAYFKIQDPSGMCHSSAVPHVAAGPDSTPARDKRTITSVPKPDRKHPKSNATTCWNHEEERVLLEERRARLETFTTRSGLGNEYEHHTQFLFLGGIEKALNATSTSEIRFEDALMKETMVLPSIHYLVTNASLELHKEGYELARDLFLEMHAFNHRGPEWEGWNQDDIGRNLTDAIFFSRENMTLQSIFDNFVRFGEAFDLRYEKPENLTGGNAPYGKFTYLGREPEKLGLRHLRHTLDGFIRLFYKIQNPSTPGLCSSTVQTRAKRSIGKRYVTTNPALECIRSIVMCWSKEQDPVLLEERRARLENFFNKEVKADEHDRFADNYLESLAAALNATSATEIHFDKVVRSIPILRFMNYLLTNSSIELHKEGYEIIRDMYLEMLEIRDHNPDWDGYDEHSLNGIMTASDNVDELKRSVESIFYEFIKFGLPFNLRYQELVNRDSKDESDKPVFGKLTYIGEEPEKLGVRRFRHILDGFVKLYFKIQDPSRPMVCNSTMQLSAEESQGETPTLERRSVEKRSVTADPNSESINTKCWSEEDKVLQEERLERLADFADRHMLKEALNLRTNSFLESIEAALNATSTSEIHIEDPDRESMHVFIESLAENASLELRKEGYEISRDVYLEIYELYNHNPEWDGYDMDSITRNLTASNFLSVNVSKEVKFNDVVTFSRAFNLRYEELGTRESGAEPNKPVFGKFTYVGEEPEKLGVRHLRHILDAIAKLYFKTQDPSSICNSTEQSPTGEGKDEKPTADSIPDPTKAKCWSAEQDPVLLEERRSRLKSFADSKKENDMYNSHRMKFLDAIETALNATSTSEIHLDVSLSRTMPLLSFIQDHAPNSSLDLYKESLEIMRDLNLEIYKLTDHHSEWKGFDLNSMVNNLTDTGMSRGYNSFPEKIFNDFKKFGRAFNLRYEELEKKDSADEPDKPVFGKFIYLGEEPEQLGIRHIRHILDGFVRFYFRVQNPSTSGQCNSAAQTPVKRSVEKRSVTEDPVPESSTAKCWSEEQDKILEEERLDRLGAFALRIDMIERDIAYMKAFLEDINAALNATSISEIHFNNDVDHSPLLNYTEYLSENSSLDIRKEGYEINRDLHFEFFKFRMHSPEWDGYNLKRIVDNITAGNLFAVNLTQEAVFNDIVTASNAFNLRYEELGTRESGAKPNKPVFGKFTYVGEEPENLGVRHLRHILDAFVKFYFKTQEPSSVCKGEASTKTPVLDATNAKCWNVEDDPALLEERKERLHDYAIWNDRYQAEHLYRKNFMDAIGEALTATNASEIHFDKNLLTSTPIISCVQNFTMDSSLELYQEGLEFVRDLYLEIDELKDRTPEWEGYNIDTILNNLTDSSKSDSHKTTSEMMFSGIANFGRAFNLRYEELEKRDSADEPDKPVFGKFIYLGEEPEKLGIRHIRHILDGFVRFYFKVKNPTSSNQCNSAVQTPAKRSVEKRSVTADPGPKTTTAKCWSEEQDKILEEERLERLGSFALRIERNEKDNSYTKAFMEGIEAALNATSMSEIHFDDDTRRSPLLKYMEFLSENSSLDIRKEAYEINRDLHLELFKFKMHSPEWDGYNLNRIADNITASHIFAVNLTHEAMFNDIVTFSNAFNLRYDELGSRESGAEPNKPVFGKFTYVGEEPENVGVRHLRHILDAFAKYYFKTQEPSSLCNGETSTGTAASEATTAKCWNVEDDPALLQERRERLEAYAIWNEKYQTQHLYMQKYLNAIGEALNATSATDIQFDESLLGSTPILSFIEYLAMNSSLELHKEGLEIARDLYLEIDELTDRTAEWEGYDFNAIQNNLTESRNSDGYKPTTEITFKDITNFGRAFDLRYEEIENEESGDKTDKPVVGKFTYLGEEPEKLGIRHIRHILDGFVRFYFKVRNPSMAAACNSSAVGGGNNNAVEAL